MSCSRRYDAATAIRKVRTSWISCAGPKAAATRRLGEAVRKVEIPVFLIQPPRDASLEPARVLGGELQRRSSRHAVKVYPPDMPEDQQGHCFGGARGMHVWAQDVLAFFGTALR